MDLESLLRTDLEALFNLAHIEAMRENKDKHVINVFIFIGGKDARQREPFLEAIGDLKVILRQKFGITIKTTEVYNDRMHSKDFWGPRDVTVRLCGSDIHFIITHFHQGNIARNQRQQGAWNIENILAQYGLWKFHLGFFNGIYIYCPVFTQNKRVYITLGNPLTIPSIFIDIPDSPEGWDFSEADARLLEQFVNAHGAAYNNNFVVKLPFVTHMIPKYPVGLEATKEAIFQYTRQEKVLGYIPYVIIQPR